MTGGDTPMTLHPLSEALLADWTADWHDDGAVEIEGAVEVLRDRLAALEAAVRAETAGRMAALETALAGCITAWHVIRHGSDDFRDCAVESCRKACAALAAAAAPVVAEERE